MHRDKNYVGILATEWAKPTIYVYEVVQDISWLSEMPYCAISSSEWRCEFGKPAVAKNDYVNNNFLKDLKPLYHGDMLNNLNFNNFTVDALNASMANDNSIKFSLFIGTSGV